MTDADLIYNALLRAERRLEERYAPDASAIARLAALQAVIIIREEIGNGIAARAPAGLDAISGKGG